MSTKVYTGIRFKATTIVALCTDMKRAFETLNRLACEHEASFLAHIMANRHDQAWLAEFPAVPETGPDMRSLYWAAQDELRERQRKIRGNRERDPAADSEIIIRVWARGRRFYGYVATEVKGVRDYLVASGIAEDFGYWNNTDPDESVSPREWAQRKRVWNDLLRGDANPSFAFNGDDYHDVSREQVAAYLPEPAKRAPQLAHDRVFDQWHRETGQPKFEVNNIGTLFGRFRRACESDQDGWGARLAAMTGQLTASLPVLAL